MLSTSNVDVDRLSITPGADAPCKLFGQLSAGKRFKCSRYILRLVDSVRVRPVVFTEGVDVPPDDITDSFSFSLRSRKM